MDERAKFESIMTGAEAVVFDFDNVIVDSEPFHYRAYADVFAAHGHVLDRREYWLEWTSKGGGAEGEIARHGLDLDPAAIRAGKDPVYTAFCRGGEIPLFPAAREIIELCAAAGLRLAIASGSYGRDIRALLAAHGLAARFEVVAGKDDSKLLKPHPAPFLIAAERLRLDPGACVAIEDAEKGVRSARAAGMPVILLATALTRDFAIGGADLRLEDLETLRDLLREIYCR